MDDFIIETGYGTITIDDDLLNDAKNKAVEYLNLIPGVDIPGPTNTNINKDTTLNPETDIKLSKQAMGYIAMGGVALLAYFIIRK